MRKAGTHDDREQTRRRFKRLCVLAWLLVIAVVVTLLTLSLWRRNPRAVIRVVDALNKPIAGATITPYAMRPKRQGGHSGHYRWLKDRNNVPPQAVVTDEMGTAIVPYPKFVAECIETGQITVAVKHPGYISDTRDILVSTSLPSGAPWSLRLKVILNRLRNGPVTRPGPIVLEQGQTLILKPAAPLAATSRLYAQTSSKGEHDDDFWDTCTPGMVVSRKHALGRHAVRLIGLGDSNQVMFSETTDIAIEPGAANTLSLSLKPGKTLRGRLSSNVARPVVDGRVVVNIASIRRQLKGHSPEWHTWTTVKQDGSFEITSLPAGDLEIVALCQGFISASGPGQQQSSTTYHPHKHVIDSNGLDIVIEMEPTARLEVTVYDDEGRPVEGVRAMTWPNVRWGDYAATIFCSDLYNTIDLLQRTNNRQDGFKQEIPPGFSGLSDKTGLAILSNVPANQTHFAVDHPDYVLPKATAPSGAPRRYANINLRPGETTQTSVTLEPRNKDPLSHY